MAADVDDRQLRQLLITRCTARCRSSTRANFEARRRNASSTSNSSHFSTIFMPFEWRTNWRNAWRSGATAATVGGGRNEWRRTITARYGRTASVAVHWSCNDAAYENCYRCRTMQHTAGSVSDWRNRMTVTCGFWNGSWRHAGVVWVHALVNTTCVTRMFRGRIFGVGLYRSEEHAGGFRAFCSSLPFVSLDL